MFWDNWIPDRFVIKPAVCGIEALITEEGTSYFFTVLKKQGNKLEVLEQGWCKDVSGLPTQIKKNKWPCVVCVNGKGIILRKISFSSGEEPDSEAFLQQYLPGLPVQDFNIQLFGQQNNTVFAAIQRKEQGAPVLEELMKALPELADQVIGAPAILFISPLLDQYNFLQPNLSRVELLDGFVGQITPTTETADRGEVSIDGLKIPSTHLLAFSVAFGYLTGQSVYTSPNTELLPWKQKHVEKNRLRFAVTFFVALSFGLCLINFLFFSTYFSKTTKLDAELGLYQEKYDKINELLSSYEKKKSLIEETGLLENYSFSTYTDRIAATIPKEVILTDFVFNPLIEEDLSEDSLMNFNKKLIMIKGNCTKSLLINEWVNVLKTQNFITDVNLEKFSFSNDGNQPNFEIKIVTE